MRTAFFCSILLVLLTGCDLFSNREDCLYTIEAECESCTVTPKKVTLYEGENAEFIIILSDGYEVAEAYDIETGIELPVINNKIVVTATGNATIKIVAEKVVKYYTINVVNETNNDSLGTVAPLGVTTVKEGDSLRVSAITEGLCSSIEKFIVDGLPLSENSYKFNDTHGNHEVIIKFKKNIDAWNLVHAIWKLKYVEIDGYGAIPPYDEIFIFYKNGTYNRYYNGEFRWKMDWTSSLNFNWGGWDCTIDIVNETTLVSSYINSYNQVVRKYYQNIGKLPS